MLIRLLVGLVLVAAVAAAALWAIVWPPSPLALPERGGALEGVTLIEPSATRREGMRLVIDGARIGAIEPAGAQASGSFAGAFVLPGLVDMHVHFPPPTLPGQTELFAFLHLYHGVLTVRDAGDVDGQSTAPAQRGVDEGRFPGPRIVACGPYVDGEPPLWRNTLVARNADEGRAAVRRVAEAGFGCVKVYNQLDALTLAAIRAEAHARGLPVIGHVPGQVPFELARLDDAQHGIGVPPPLPESVRFPQILRGWLELDDARLDAIVAASLEHHIAHTPTLVTIDRLAAQEDRATVLVERDASYLPGFYRKVVWNPDGGISAAGALASDEFGMVRAALRTHQRVIKRLFDAGVEIHTGTDSLVAFVVPGASLHRELRLLADAGLTPEQVLALSTRVSARALGVEGLGELRTGAPAELLVFREDPTRDLAALESLLAVVRDGRIYPRADLDAQLERYRAHYDSAAYEALITPLVRRALASTRSRD